MLVIHRTQGESVKLVTPDGTEIFVHVLRDGQGRLKLGFDAPRDVTIMRTELLGPGPTRPAA